MALAILLDSAVLMGYSYLYHLVFLHLIFLQLLQKSFFIGKSVDLELPLF